MFEYILAILQRKDFLFLLDFSVTQKEMLFAPCRTQHLYQCPPGFWKPFTYSPINRKHLQEGPDRVRHEVSMFHSSMFSEPRCLRRTRTYSCSTNKDTVQYSTPLRKHARMLKIIYDKFYCLEFRYFRNSETKTPRPTFHPSVLWEAI